MIEWISQQLLQEQQKFYCSDGIDEEEGKEKARGNYAGDYNYYPAERKPNHTTAAISLSRGGGGGGGDTNEDDETTAGGSTIMIPTLKRPSYVLKRKTLRAKFKKPKRIVRFAHQAAVESRHNAGDTCPPKRQRRQQQRQQQQQHAMTTAAVTTACDCWYRKSDLLRFKEEAMELAASKKKAANARGTESMSRNRRRHRMAAIRYVLIAHKRGKPDSYVAELAAKLGRWNRDIAVGDAIADYYEAYHPSLLSLVPRPASSNPPTISLVARGGRSSSSRRCRDNHGWPRPKMRPTETGRSISSNSNTIMKTPSPSSVVNAESNEKLVRYAYNR